MAAIADGVARSFRLFTPLQAYRLDIAGSLAGVIIFSILSFISTPPVCWGVIVCLVYVVLLLKDLKLTDPVSIIQMMSLVLLTITLGNESLTAGFTWSPYYKIGIHDKMNGGYRVTVNGIPQQSIESIVLRKTHEPFYFIPYQRLPKNTTLNNVLIIGAGTGGDVAIALKEGARHVDAVEIDPRIYQIGKTLNPDHPYFDPRVTIHINDGRAFIQNLNATYDLIIFALPDSLTLVSGQSSLRLENYLFTLESITKMRQHLSVNGIFAMYNYYREPWLIDRFANTLATAFNHAPCLDTYGADKHWLSVLTIDKTVSLMQCPQLWQPISDKIIQPSSDNHPFIYLKENRIPALYLGSLLLILCITITAIKVTGTTYRSLLNYTDLFLMGAAFLLLETKNIINFALYFGTTWLVNALVFIGILMTVYLAIEVTSRVKFFNQHVLYGVLLVTLFIAWLIPEYYLLTLSLPLRFIAATALAFAPIFVANLIFAERFRNTSHSTDAFGANLIGAMFGGVLEYISLVIGYHALIIVVAVLYTFAILFMPKHINKLATTGTV